MQLVSRKEAIEHGLTRYFTGKPCSKGHTDERMVSSRRCRECRRLDRSKWVADNPERLRELNRRSAQKNRAKRNAYSRQYNRRNLRRLAELNRQWLKKNPHKRRQYESEPRRKIATILRVRLRNALKGGFKIGHGVRDLGCSVEEFRQYIEARFSAGMSWENHGKLWNLDHKRCLASFDLTDREQVLQACHFSNLEPLLISDHQLKTRSDREIIRAVRAGQWQPQLHL